MTRTTERAAILLLLAVPLLQAAVYFYAARDMEYGYTHDFLTYAQGFQRRALVGEALSLFPRLDTPALLSIGLAGVLLFSAAVYGLLAPRRPTLSEAAVFAFIVAAPGLLPHYSYLAGYLDSILATVAAVSVWLGCSRAAWPIKAAGLLGLTLLGVLIHEGYLLMFAPAAFAGWLLTDWRKPADRIAIAVTAALAALATLVMVRVAVDAPAQAELTAALARTHAVLQPDVFSIAHFSHAEQAAYVRRSYTPKIIASAVGTLILLAPIVAAFAVMLRRAVGDEQPRLIKALVWLSCLAPMALVVVGHDVARWMAAGFTSAGLLILALRRRRDEPANEASATWFWPVFCFSLINGPLHAVVGTSLLEHLADVAGFKR